MKKFVLVTVLLLLLVSIAGAQEAIHGMVCAADKSHKVFQMTFTVSGTVFCSDRYANSIREGQYDIAGSILTIYMNDGEKYKGTFLITSSREVSRVIIDGTLYNYGNCQQ
jgi:hypothetical protein